MNFISKYFYFLFISLCFQHLCPLLVHLRSPISVEDTDQSDQTDGRSLSLTNN